MTMRIAVLILSSFLAFTSAFAQNARTNVDGSLSPILIPINYFGRGQFGSLWYTWVAINNHSDKPYATPGVIFRIVECLIPEGCSSETIPAGGYGDLETSAPGGLLLYVRKDAPRDLSFRAHFGIYGDEESITELPIVREAEFTREAINFPVVSLFHNSHVSRITLRIYGVDAQPNTRVRVELGDWVVPRAQIDAAKVVTLDVPPSPGTTMPIYPAFAQLQLQNAPEFRDLGSRSSAFNVRVVPLPLSTGELPRIWAFISVTTNQTERVYLQRPQ